MADADDVLVPAGDLHYRFAQRGVADGKLAMVGGGEGRTGKEAHGAGEVVIGKRAQVVSENADLAVAAGSGGKAFADSGEVVHRLVRCLLVRSTFAKGGRGVGVHPALGKDAGEGLGEAMDGIYPGGARLLDEVQ